VVVDFIDEYRGRFGVEPICQVLAAHGWRIGVSSYYAAKSRPPPARALSDLMWADIIQAVFDDPTKGRRIVGVRKMWHLLRRDGYQIARCTVARIMRQLGLKGVRRGGWKPVTTRPDPAATRPPDLVHRDFHPDRPNALWIVDFTYVWTHDRYCFTAFVKDAFSRRLVGWRTSGRMPVDLPLDALEMALWVRGRDGQDVTGLIHHSDAGSQYTAVRYAARLAQAGLLASVGTVGDSYDNAMAESVIGLYKAECVHRDGPFHSLEQLELATCAWVDYYNRYRLHSSIGYVTPIEYEQAHYDSLVVA